MPLEAVEATQKSRAHFGSFPTSASANCFRHNDFDHRLTRAVSRHCVCTAARMHQAEMLRQRVEQFAIAIARLCDGLQSEPRATALAVQLRDAATSVSMNYRAACRARSHDEFVAKICVVVEEADEVVGWLNLLAGIGRSSGPEHQRLAQEAVELLRIFAASKRTAINNQQRRRAHKPRRRQ